MVKFGPTHVDRVALSIFHSKRCSTNTRLLAKSLLMVILMGGCATPVLNIQEPTEQQLVAAQKSLDYAILPESPLPETMTQLNDGFVKASAHVVVAARRVCQRLKPRIDTVRCEAILTMPKIYNDKDVNAHADKHDNIAVYTGLLLNMPVESEIAAVLAHEYAHVMLGHVHKKMTNMMTGMVLTSMLGGALAGASGTYLDSQNLQALQQLGLLVGSRAYSPEMEIEADRLAIYILKEARYPITAMRDSIVRLHRLKSPNRSSGVSARVGFLETHPSNNRRIGHILSAIRDVTAGVPLMQQEEKDLEEGDFEDY